MTPMNYVTSTHTPESEIQMLDLVFSIGGSSTAIHEARSFSSKVILAALDNPNELSQHELYFRELGVQVHAIGDSHTMSSLFEGSAHPAAATVVQVSDSVATIGVGGAPAAGNRAAEITCKSENFESFLRRLRDQAVQLLNGAPCGIRIWLAGSISGGTASGGLQVFAESLEATFAGLGVPVEVHICIIGQIGYTGISEASSLNAPCVLTSLVDFVTSKAPSRVCRYLHAEELPTLGINGEKVRNQIVAIGHQALNANATRRTIERDAPNKATVNALGNIDARTAHYHMSPESLVALPASAAKQFLSRWRTLIEFPRHDPSLIRSLDWIERSIPFDAPSIEEIVEENRTAPMVMADLVVRPTEAKSYRLMANLRSMGQIDMCQIDHQFATPWQSEADIRKRQVLLSTFDHMLSRELRSTTQRITRFSTNIDASLPYIDKNVRNYMHARLQSGKDKAVFRLTEVLKNIRKMANQRAIFVGHQEALLLSHSMVIEEVRAMKSVSSEIENCLAGCLASIGPGVTEDLVVPNSITECLPHLIAMLNLPEERKLKRLNRLMGPVTRAGMQLIVNSTSSRFDSIAQSIVYGKPTFASPPLGAKITSKSAPVFYVLPEMEAKEGELLTEAILRLDPNGLVFFCDDNACGAAVVTFRFQRFSDIESLLPGILKTDLERALGSPNFQLRFPNGIAHLNRLGISYDPITKTIAFKPVNLTRN